MQSNGNGQPPQAVLSVDVEFFSDTPAFRRLDRDWPYEEDGQTGIERLLELFEKHNVRSTFFVVAKHVRSHRSLFTRILEKGHEIASHTTNHIPLGGCSDEMIESEVRGSKAILEDALGVEIRGFRSPACQMNPRIAEAIARSGYRYDSSVVPGIPIPGWYGVPNAPKRPFPLSELFRISPSNVIEFPLSTHPVTHTPVSGFWMRFLGVRFAVSSIRSQLARREVPVIYVHPWEFVASARLSGMPWRMYYRTGEPALRMVEHLIEKVRGRFVCMRDLIDG